MFSKKHVLDKSDPKIRLASIENLVTNKTDTLFASYEKKTIPDSPWYSTNTDQLKQIIVLRDPLNNASSLIKAGLHRHFPAQSFVRLYCQYAEAIESEEHYIEVRYNDWCMDESYREALCMKLDIRVDSRAWGKIPYQGNASSFNSSIESIMNGEIFNRYQEYLDHPYIKTVMESEELASIAHKKFGQSFQDILAGALT